jgi:choline dehydrogenase-like flavoprotein
MTREQVDLLIVGSGPVASAIAREVSAALPDARILMAEMGPAITDPPGEHIQNRPSAEHPLMRRRSQGPQADAVTSMDAFNRGDPPTQHPGLELVDPEGGMPLAGVATNVGGMGTFWNLGTPRPRGTELAPFVPPDEWEAAIARAEVLLSVRSDPEDAGVAFRASLAGLLQSTLPSFAGFVPVRRAARADGGGIGARDVLVPPGESLPPGVDVRPDTTCMSISTQRGRVSGATLADRVTGRRYDVGTRMVAVAGGALRTPQLLWASGIRPLALGRHLMDHPMIWASMELDPARVEGLVDPEERRSFAFFVPFDDLGHPWVMGGAHTWEGAGFFGTGVAGRHAGSMVRVGRYDGAAGFMGFGVLGRTWPRPENRILFSEEIDAWGLPRMRLRFAHDDRERAEIGRMIDLLHEVVAAYGDAVEGFPVREMPIGSSNHHLGTVRMGARDDGTSVCDPRSRVWGTDGLFVAGNGVVPTATASNPTLMSVAFAVRTAEAVVAELS